MLAKGGRGPVKDYIKNLGLLFPIICLALTFSSCMIKNGAQVIDEKVAIITMSQERSGDWHAIQPLISKYGEEKIIHFKLAGTLYG